MKKLKHLLTEVKEYAEAIGLCIVMEFSKMIQKDLDQDGRPVHIFTLCATAIILVVVLILSVSR